MALWSSGLAWVACSTLLAALLAPLPGSAHALRTAAGSQPPAAARCPRRDASPCLTPAQLRQYYQLDPLLRHGITGRGRTIALVEAFGSPTLRADLHAFDQAFGLPDPRLRIVAPLGQPPPGSVGDLAGSAAETSLDVEWAHVLAPGAQLVVLLSAGSGTAGLQGLPHLLQVLRYALAHHLADVLANSWGVSESTLAGAAGQALVAQFHHLFTQAAAAGVTVTVASGDSGASGFDGTGAGVLPGRAVQFPADDPLVLSVGGTTLSLADSHGAAGEVAWSFSGGGASTTYAQPAYQRRLSPAMHAVLQGRRGVPDVAFDGDLLRSPVLIYVQGAWRTAGGTSLGAPAWAGIAALADQAAGHDLGAINAALYRIAASPRYTRDFRDIVQGSNDILSPYDPALPEAPAYRAAPGWDAVTGLGTPRIAPLVADLARR